MDITFCAISTDVGMKQRLSFERDDKPFTAAGYDAVVKSLHAPGSTARFRAVGAAKGGRIVDVTPLLASTWDDTEANIRAALA